MTENSAAPIISISHVWKYFGSLPALQDVCLDIAPGERVVIIGPSGSGKSTLLRSINRLEQIDQGSIIVQGQDIQSDENNINEMRQNLGMVFQQFNLFPHLTAGENVMLAPRIVKSEPEEDVRALAAEMLARVGLEDKFNAFPDQLSGGQQQRVAIARALAMRPKMLLCDEITSALDPELVGEVLEVVRKLAAEGMTLIMVTHEMRFAREVGNKLVFMHKGKVHEAGAPKALFANPATPELVRSSRPWAE